MRELKDLYLCLHCHSASTDAFHLLSGVQNCHPPGLETGAAQDSKLSGTSALGERVLLGSCALGNCLPRLLQVHFHVGFLKDKKLKCANSKLTYALLKFNSYGINCLELGPKKRYFQDKVLYHEFMIDVIYIYILTSHQFYLFLMFILFILRERESTQVWGGAERGRERIPGRLCPVSTESDLGLDLTNHEIGI